MSLASKPLIQTAQTVINHRQPGVLANNIGKLTRDLGNYLSQDHSGFKKNALKVSVLGLCASRVAIAFNSARKAQGTKEENFRKTEAIGTLFREATGYMLSFFTFGLIHKQTQQRLAKSLVTNGKRLKRPSQVKNYVSNVAGELKAFVQNKQRKITSIETPYMASEAPEFITKMPENPRLQNLMKRYSGKDKSVQEMAENLYNIHPIMVGAVPTVILSGAGVEYFNINYAEDLFKSWAKAHKDRKDSDKIVLPNQSLARSIYPDPALQSFTPADKATYNPFQASAYNREPA